MTTSTFAGSVAAGSDRCVRARTGTPACVSRSITMRPTRPVAPVTSTGGTAVGVMMTRTSSVVGARSLPQGNLAKPQSPSGADASGCCHPREGISLSGACGRQHDFITEPGQLAEDMEKLVYVLWGDGTPDAGDAIRDVLFTHTVPRLQQLGGRGITVNVHDSDAAQAPSPVPAPPGEDPHVAEVCVWLSSYDRRTGFEEAVAAAGQRFAGYLVTESLYEDYGTTPHAGPRTWPEGTRFARRADGIAHSPTRRAGLRQLDRALARHPVPAVRRAPAALPLCPQRSRPARHRWRAGD